MKVQSFLGGNKNQFELAKAILVYKNQNKNADRELHPWEPVPPELEGSAMLLCSVHDVRHDYKTGQPIIVEGQLLARDVLETMLRDLAESNENKVRSIIPENLLFADLTEMIWWVPAHRRTIYFSTADQSFNRDVSQKEVAHPNLLFRATPSSFQVFALAESKRPDPSTPLFMAPYCNIYWSGDMCRGDIKYPGTVSPSQMKAWENVFFDSRFTHSSLSDKITKHPKGHNGLWREMLTAKVFKSKYLFPTNGTLDLLLRRKVK